jgi:hypothetical protein
MLRPDQEKIRQRTGENAPVTPKPLGFARDKQASANFGFFSWQAKLKAVASCRTPKGRFAAKKTKNAGETPRLNAFLSGRRHNIEARTGTEAGAT